jgi:hypothetical protein
MDTFPPELNLLETLSGDDENLFVVLQVFGATNDDAAFERARHAVTTQFQEGVVDLVEKTAQRERVLQSWEARPVLAQKDNWLQRDGVRFFLRLR